MAHAAVEVESVTYAYPGTDSPALEGVSVRVEPGERLGILGPNGGGKSTLVKLILGVLTPDSGRVRIFGDTPAAASRSGVIGYVAQRAELELGLPISVREAVMLGAAWRTPPWRRIPGELAERIQRMLDLVGCREYQDRHAGSLSGGQLQRVLIARALAANPRILVLDEPTVGIDAAGQERFAELLHRVHRELGVTLIVVSHDLRAIVAGSDRVACLARRLHSHTSPEGLTPQVLAELFTHDVAGLLGSLRGVHVHAHAAGEPCADPSHSCADHRHAHAAARKPSAGGSAGGDLA
ncbi:MAG: metal ABC transporter ATP-binding protein [Phycisphaerales bacterium]